MVRQHVYVGGFTEEFGWLESAPAVGIEHFAFDDDTGVLEHVDTVKELVSPHYLAVHPHRPALYALEYVAPGRAVSFSVSGEGRLDRVGATASVGDGPVAISVHPSGEHAYVANWNSASLGVLRVNDLGALSDGELIAQSDPGVAEDRVYIHQFRSAPSGSSALATYFGLDRVVAYRADADGVLSLEPVATVQLPRGSAPRHVEYHPSGNAIYVVGEKDAMLYVLAADDAIPTTIAAAVPAFSHEFRLANRPSELTLHPSGRSLYVANRGSDSITMFAVDESGSVEPAGAFASVGAGPRDITIDPTGRYLLAANCDSGDVVVFGIGEDLRLQPIAEPVKVGSPSSVVFVAEAPSEPDPVRAAH